jgi:hypothetical protein
VTLTHRKPNRPLLVPEPNPLAIRVRRGLKEIPACYEESQRGTGQISTQASGKGGREDCRRRLPGAGLKIRANRNLYSCSGLSLLIVNRRSGELHRIPRKSFGSQSAALRTGSALVQQPP